MMFGEGNSLLRSGPGTPPTPGLPGETGALHVAQVRQAALHLLLFLTGELVVELPGE